MPIEAKFTQGDIKKRFEKAIQVIVKRQIKLMQLLGEQCVNEARTNKTYTVQTGNLSGSTGYKVFVDGVAVHEDFIPVNGNMEGVKVGQNLAEKVGAKYKNGVCLVVVAGMNYAIHLEAKGYNVLTSAELYAKKELPVMVAELKKAINEVI